MKNLKPKRIITTTIIVTCAWVFAGSVFTGCSKKEKGCMDPMGLNFDPKVEEDDGSCVLAGKGGKDSINAYPQHHGAAIFSSESYRDTAYVKFNAIDFPGTSPANYDLVIAGDKNKNYVTIKRLKPGRYYIYMTGWDNSIGERVTGGIPVTLTQSHGGLNLAVPVVE